jgi:transcriptional regulator with XRE-family HTH domain
LGQRELGKRLGATARTVQRWENDTVAVTPEVRARLLGALADAPPDTLAALKRAIAAATPTAPSSAPQAPPAPPTSTTLQLALLSAAEQLDVSPKRLRAAIVALLQALDGAGVSAREGAQLLAAAPPTTPHPRGERT